MTRFGLPIMTYLCHHVKYHFHVDDEVKAEDLVLRNTRRKKVGDDQSLDIVGEQVIHVTVKD